MHNKTNVRGVGKHFKVSGVFAVYLWYCWFSNKGTAFGFETHWLYFFPLSPHSFWLYFRRDSNFVVLGENYT